MMNIILLVLIPGIHVVIPLISICRCYVLSSLCRPPEMYVCMYVFALVDAD